MRLFSVLLLAILLAGCGGGSSEPTVVPSPTPTPAEIGAQIGRATQASPSLHYEIILSGKSVYTDNTRLFAINSITGDLKRPDSTLSILQVKGALGVAEIRTVTHEGKQYFTNPITRQWGCLTPGTAFDPAVLFDPTKGIEYLLQQGFENVSFVGIEDLDGRKVYHLRGSLPAALVQPISYGLLGAGPVALDLWADVETSRAAKIVLVDTESDPEQPTTWTMTFSEYEKTVDVRAPVEC